jgi:hypothetical protein
MKSEELHRVLLKAEDILRLEFCQKLGPEAPVRALDPETSELRDIESIAIGKDGLTLILAERKPRKERT